MTADVQKVVRLGSQAVDFTLRSLQASLAHFVSLDNFLVFRYFASKYLMDFVPGNVLGLTCMPAQW